MKYKIYDTMFPGFISGGGVYESIEEAQAALEQRLKTAIYSEGGLIVKEVEPPVEESKFKKRG